MDEQELAQPMSETMEKGGWVGEHKARRKDGSSFDGQFMTSVILDDRGNPVAVLASILDITERKRSEELIKKNAEELKDLIEIAAHELRHRQLCSGVTPRFSWLTGRTWTGRRFKTR